MCNDIWLQSFLQKNLVMAIVDIPLQDLRHDVCEVPKQLSEMVAEQRTRHVKSFFTIIVTIVFRNFAQTRFYQFVCHVPQEEGLFVDPIRQS